MKSQKELSFGKRLAKVLRKDPSEGWDVFIILKLMGLLVVILFLVATFARYIIKHYP